MYGLGHLVGGHKVEAAHIVVDPFNVHLQLVPQVYDLLRVLGEGEGSLVALATCLHQFAGRQSERQCSRDLPEGAEGSGAGDAWI